MHILRAISRVLIGAVFILSGFFKAIDPIGGGLKIKEYLAAFHLGFIDFMDIPFAIMLAVAEFIIGVSILKGLRMKFFAIAVFWFMLFFTMLTLYSAIYNPVKDCGCFGEAVHLTNWQTFYKNIVLILAAWILYLQRNKFEPIAGKIVERTYIVIYTVFILGISLYAFVRMPQIDLGDYKPGTDLIENGGGTERVYNTTFIYSKGGKEQNFTIDNIPDSTWSFVDSKTILVNEGEAANRVDFILKDSNGNYVAQDILNISKPLFLASFYNVDKISKKAIGRLMQFKDTIAANGGVLYIVSGSSVEQSQNVFNECGIPILYADYKTMLSFNRSNGGLTYIYDADIIGKWARGNYPFLTIRKILDRDPEILMANNIIGDQLFAEICIALIFFMIVILRFVSKFMYKRYLLKLKALEIV
ncbi:MAG: DoxX family protein [Bacteroidales bacterium]